jgi:hypothetical protein
MCKGELDTMQMSSEDKYLHFIKVFLNFVTVVTVTVVTVAD